jgi:type IV pilus assembly protein PilN
MIRINLAQEKAAKTKTKAGPPGPSIPTGALTGLVLPFLFIAASLLLIGAAFWVQSNKIKDLESRIAADEKRQKDLEAIKQQVDQFQQRKAILENKVLVIEQLRLAQKSPVHMLDEISKALPDYVWLTGMTETRGSVQFQGQSNSLAAVADFIGGLQRSGWFPVVDLGTATEQRSIVNFTVTGSFKDPEVAAKEKAAAAAAAAAAPPAKAKGKGKR